jgi:carbon storage regulator
MLVLTRKPEQSIIIAGDIVVTVLGVEGGRVKLGIQAPEDVSIVREEVQAAVKGENRRAADLAREHAGLDAALAALRRAERRAAS